MKTNLFIPTKIRIGFQNREDTFTGKLAYIIYYDEKGKIRKEVSWNQWRDEKIDYIDIDNVPTNGYIINKGVERDGYWGRGRSLIRIYDPRDFEFEIDVDNLIGILLHSDISNCNIDTECIFAWSKGNLILLPINSQEYIESTKYTSKQSLKVSAKDLVPGTHYIKKKNDEQVLYLGYFLWYEWKFGDTKEQTLKGKRHIFVDEKQYVRPLSVSTLGYQVSKDIDKRYEYYLDKFINSSNHKLVVDIKFKDIKGIDDISYDDIYYTDKDNCLYILNYRIRQVFKNDDEINVSQHSLFKYNTYYTLSKNAMGGVQFNIHADNTFTYGSFSRYEDNTKSRSMNKLFYQQVKDKPIMSLDEFKQHMINFGCIKMVLVLEDGIESDEQII